MIKAVIFDIGNVLIHWSNRHMLEDMEKTLEVPYATIERIWNEYDSSLSSGAITEAEFWEKVAQKSHTSFTLPEESLLSREFTKRFTFNEEMMQHVRKLKQQGYKLGIISNTIDAHVSVMETKSFFDLFDVVILSNQAKVTKPSQAIYKAAIDQLNVDPSEAVFIDDLLENVIGANTYGIHGIQMVNNEQVKKDLQNLGVLTSQS